MSSSAFEVDSDGQRAAHQRLGFRQTVRGLSYATDFRITSQRWTLPKPIHFPPASQSWKLSTNSALTYSEEE